MRGDDIEILRVRLQEVLRDVERSGRDDEEYPPQVTDEMKGLVRVLKSHGYTASTMRCDGALVVVLNPQQVEDTA
jgi:hypothetical protein